MFLMFAKYINFTLFVCLQSITDSWNLVYNVTLVRFEQTYLETPSKQRESWPKQSTPIEDIGWRKWYFELKFEKLRCRLLQSRSLWIVGERGLSIRIRRNQPRFDLATSMLLRVCLHLSFLYFWSVNSQVFNKTEKLEFETQSFMVGRK